MSDHTIVVIGGPDSKASACNAGNPGSIPGLGRSPGEGNGNPLQHSCLEKSHGRRSLIGYSPWGRKESDTTERTFIHTRIFKCQFSECFRGFPGGSAVKRLLAMQETRVRFLGREDPLDKEMAMHSSTLAWKNPMDGGAY